MYHKNCLFSLFNDVIFNKNKEVEEGEIENIDNQKIFRDPFRHYAISKKQ